MICFGLFGEQIDAHRKLTPVCPIFSLWTPIWSHSWKKESCIFSCIFYFRIITLIVQPCFPSLTSILQASIFRHRSLNLKANVLIGPWLGALTLGRCRAKPRRRHPVPASQPANQIDDVNKDQCKSIKIDAMHKNYDNPWKSMECIKIDINRCNSM